MASTWKDTGYLFFKVDRELIADSRSGSLDTVSLQHFKEGASGNSKNFCGLGSISVGKFECFEKDYAFHFI